MRILLLGYGKMGKAIEQIALDRGHEIAGRIDSENLAQIASSKADVAIEFSQPEAAFNNIKACLENNIPVACGTTGWLERKAEVDALTKKYNGTFFYASNYSVGVNIFFKLNRQLAVMMKSFDQYRVSIDETHHTEKKDAPSGTAITLAEGLITGGIGKTWTKQPSDNADEITINSFRIDAVPGTHIVKYASVIDDLEIRHIAHSREGFARGAVMVAEWLPGKKGVLGMDDFLKF
ncbi:MAG TPA: 4-hydroxy-tetrahydrodipicolinate reductase [Cyclobacteriaceae bacterium]|nr:4-hydroxy-tetrahydrodipicolinate reductase [Cyclobacteriaceae bacterium]HMV09642.1 4-hydroxy-tetrahydrodipicolinate reductase [Cyclobacteriaceae bacterium]HMV89539.1 4-hydroxy-tetrahydrodipicolinate reductase [Cyclobacteriaceae bacterium]HMX01026.1 4-hydroxy-tetrahydrodipicolinate reductase [Cyclobacteriaceae bacterium]HMX52020.1 4-hydroxy-tetrahydrodipicolinate reductase [Cyclobacteriaceae bacterium]